MRLFPLGHVVMTDAARALLHGNPDDVLARHAACSELNQPRQRHAANQVATRVGGRIVTTHPTGMGTPPVTIVTAADRSETSIMTNAEFDRAEDARTDTDPEVVALTRKADDLAAAVGRIRAVVTEASGAEARFQAALLSGNADGAAQRLSEAQAAGRAAAPLLSRTQRELEAVGEQIRQRRRAVRASHPDDASPAFLADLEHFEAAVNAVPDALSPLLQALRRVAYTRAAVVSMGATPNPCLFDGLERALAAALEGRDGGPIDTQPWAYAREAVRD